MVSRLDDILDLVDAAATRIVLCKIGILTGDAKEMPANLVRAAGLVRNAVRKLRHPPERRSILHDVIEIHSCQNEGDRLGQDALAALFNDHRDPLDVIQWKNIYEDLERAADKCEDVANVLEGIVLKSG